MEEQQNALRIAVIEEQISGLREQQRAHNSSTQSRFDRVEQKLDELTAVINRGKGAYTASLVLAGLIGGFLLKIIGAMAGYFSNR